MLDYSRLAILELLLGPQSLQSGIIRVFARSCNRIWSPPIATNDKRKDLPSRFCEARFNVGSSLHPARGVLR